MEIRDAYSEWSSSYDADANLTRDLDREVSRRMLGGREYQSIVEAGCGTGKNTEWLAGLARRVCALDLSEGMIARARARVAHDNIVFGVADLSHQWPCRSEAFDLITCNLVLEHIRDLSPLFAEAFRVAAPGAQFFVSELHPFRQYSGKQATYKRGGQEVVIRAFVHHVSDFLQAADIAGFSLVALREWWHDADGGAPPRLVTFTFERA